MSQSTQNQDTPAQPARHAIVTGASSGIGAAIARRLLDAGWHVTGLDRTPVASSEGFSAIEVDLTDAPRLAAAVGALPRVDAIVHAAGFMRTAALGELKPEDGEGMWRIHVQAASVLANALLPVLPDGARIVLIGSRTAGGAPARSQYAATKAALLGMARSWAAELAPRGITVNVVAPGATETPMLNDPGRKGTPPRTPPIGRFIRPGEVAGVVSFLLGPDAGAITGQQIVICGGGSL
ncbi:SDR family NAD(P)-dependent oxidoreductase [Cupriavidus sp. 2TAF22]|uniref:SDR family NAD(P)-dependent oxidoreductase n=1 Tax=unclassified Cupriavidus TaxID=2640874 RepID=UPI003F91E078